MNIHNYSGRMRIVSLVTVLGCLASNIPEAKADAYVEPSVNEPHAVLHIEAEIKADNSVFSYCDDELSLTVDGAWLSALKPNRIKGQKHISKLLLKPGRRNLTWEVEYMCSSVEFDGQAVMEASTGKVDFPIDVIAGGEYLLRVWYTYIKSKKMWQVSIAEKK